MVVYNLGDDFPFDRLVLGSPSAIQGGGSYSAPITIDGSPVYVQLPQCATKSGIVETRRAKYCDLLYPSDASAVASWIETLESKCCGLIDNKKHLWFTNDLTTADVEGMVTPIARPHRQGAALLVRVQLDTKRGSDKLKCRIFNDDETESDASHVNKDSTIIPLMHIEAVRFTSRSFDVVLKMEQLMLLKPEPAPKACMIRSSRPNQSDITEVEVRTDLPGDVHGVMASAGGLEETSVGGQEEHDEDSVGLIEDLEPIDLSLEVGTETADVTNSVEEGSEYDEGIDDVGSGSEKQDILDMEDGEVGLDDIEDLNAPVEVEVEGIREVSIEPEEDSESPMTLKRPNEVYYEIYRAAIEKARHMRKVAVEAYLEAKQIKSKYMLEDIDDSDGEAELEEAAGM